MYLDNLSASLLQFCNTRRLSYEKLAERCDLSARYIGKIVRRESWPTIRSLEKICLGCALTPNDLLKVPDTNAASEYRIPLQVNILPVENGSERLTSVCPRCGSTMAHSGQPFCSSCGQALSWSKLVPEPHPHPLK